MFPVKNDFSVPDDKKTEFKKIADKIAAALSGDSDPLRLEISGSGTLGKGQEVYPSQEFTENKKAGKVLASVPNGEKRQAIMHSQKIGNAIRTIDIWYQGATPDKPLAIEPYGVIQQKALALRLPTSEMDLYTYLKKIDELTSKIQNGITDESRYVMACLIRGGVYSGKKKE